MWYHGWHDWYVSSNLADASNLDGQLLPGLNPAGVPRSLGNSTIPFNYNDIDSFKESIKDHINDIGVIIMEPVRGKEPNLGFLQEIRKIANEIGAVLIFDEVTSGFRKNMGGIHLLYGVEPDIAVFGKALGNGFPISAIIGKKEVMESATSSFISSTMWTERTGFVAALATIDKMEKYNVQDDLIKYGKQINAGWKSIADKTGVNIHISGIEPLTNISFAHENPNAMQTYYAQEMLKKGYLLGSSVYSTFAYNTDIINKFIQDSEEVFHLISLTIKNNNLMSCLQGEVISKGFKRLNS